ncbi:MAG: hypothetical protein K2J13_01755, partial [Clostridia bacterium]|nr:hypothetical protein [Clostridia bacterium]
MSLRIVNLAQLEGYKIVNSRKMKSIKFKLWGSAVCITLCNAIFSFISISIGSFYVQLVVQGLYLIALLVSLADERDKCEHQPLAHTARAKRLIAMYSLVSLLLLAIATLCGCAIIVNGVRLSFVFIPIVFAVLPYLVALSIRLNMPIERHIANKFIKNCKKELENRASMIKIGITGSFAKTTVKNILTTILNQEYKAYCTPSNYNTPLGICRAVNDLPEDCEIFVAEMGARKQGDIAELCEIVKPTIGIITGVGSQHLATFKSRENIYLTKKELSDYIECVGNGFAVYNAENDFTMRMYDESKAHDKIALSIDKYVDKYLDSSSQNTISAENIECDSAGLKFTLKIGNEQKDCVCKLIGKHNLNNILLCVAVAVKLGLNIVQIANGIANLTPIEHRLQTIQLNTGITIIDDSYNSN